MAFMLANVYSKSLTMETQLGVILPQDRPHYPEGKVPQVLILLHGLVRINMVWPC